eukprot:1195832-Prorocentrum_minimum.AAC.5
MSSPSSLPSPWHSSPARLGHRRLHRCHPWARYILSGPPSLVRSPSIVAPSRLEFAPFRPTPFPDRPMTAGSLSSLLLAYLTLLASRSSLPSTDRVSDWPPSLPVLPCPIAIAFWTNPLLSRPTLSPVHSRQPLSSQTLPPRHRSRSDTTEVTKVDELRA